MITALVLHKEGRSVSASVESLPVEQLPDEEVLVEVHYSSINYKDALAVTGKGAIIRGDYPFVPGIDLAGTVISSRSSSFKAGDQVIGTGWGIGENYWGGYASQMRLSADWLVPLPASMSPKTAMALGTAGFTAMQSILTLEHHNVTSDSGEIVVTGATGGVGSLSVALLHSLGYKVVASTGKADAHEYLKRLGATRIIERDQLGEGARRPLDKGFWAGAVDSVGGTTLAALISQTKRHGCIAACGLAGGAEFATTVFPFILRGVTLAGIDSNTCPHPVRKEIWRRLEHLDTELLDSITHTIPLAQVPEWCNTLLAGRIKGRIVVDLAA